MNGDTNGPAAFAAGASALDTVTDIASWLSGGGATTFAAAFNDTFSALANLIAASPTLDLTNTGEVTMLSDGVLQAQ